ncbi:helix-turn-helix transcriptional regulator [Achromobacter insolitus]|uniref:helix-turn-helix domain-containing protein n=1 Tax=Achromobacter insolitus TaxID=217204 RepID=UPI00244EBEDB|nr:helix-turn-helix transcriptional regulator [Achromobacter insolitus]MDH3066630.1 helix-turn-helix transcriptional regulator [Achromobacter insolitus]
MSKEAVPKGQHLKQALRVAMRERSDSLSNVAAQVGISQSYLSQLMNGDKPIAQVSDMHLRSLAAYLRVPPVAGFVLAGRLAAADFLEQAPPLEERLDQALVSVCASPSAAEAQVRLEELRALSVRAKVLVVLLHRRAQQVDLLGSSNAWWTSRRYVIQE